VKYGSLTAVDDAEDVDIDGDDLRDSTMTSCDCCGIVFLYSCYLLGSTRRNNGMMMLSGYITLKYSTTKD